ncbi:MAG TPA: carbohydrate porin [Gemmataceae bacterium]|nr:carbohydrate porin [Gemmataceae bacterium]
MRLRSTPVAVISLLHRYCTQCGIASRNDWGNVVFARGGRHFLVFTRGRLGLLSLCALLGCLLAGCEQQILRRPDYPPPPGCPAPAANDKPQIGYNPPPRTAFQAVRAYLFCLRHPECPECFPPPPKEPEKKEGDDEKKSGNGDKNDNGKEKKNPDDKPPDLKITAFTIPGEPPNNGTDKKDDYAEKKDEPEEKKDEAKPEEYKPEWLNAHTQTTMVAQRHLPFPAPYTGTNSLQPFEGGARSLTSTLFLDARMWESDHSSVELIFNPEIAGGLGLSDTMGVAGFPNGEITRVGQLEPTPYVARLFGKFTFGLGGPREKVEDGPNQLPGERDIDRITVYLGKMAMTDIFDNNAYSHDPRSQMLNWSLMYNGAWDYPANVRGYDYGMAIEFNRKDWAFRWGIFGEPAEANGAAFDPRILNANGQAWELEERYLLFDHPGKIRLMAYLNHAHMGNYEDALLQTGTPPDVTATRSYRLKYGFVGNLEQEITRDLGFWMRGGWSDGHAESWAFTAIDDTIAAGFLLKGTRWRRPGDEVGLAYVFNFISAPHAAYLSAGGLDFIIGDGALNYGPEGILEVYYNLEILKGFEFTFDFQEVSNPAYNRDRGPVSIGAIRMHVEF